MRLTLRFSPLSSGLSAATDGVEAVVAAGCAYEVVALVTRRVPTLTSICREHRWAEGLLLTWLVFHLHYYRKPPSGG